MNITYGMPSRISTKEILELRSACGSKDETDKMWREAYDKSLFVATARDRDAADMLVGIGFVVGNNRHAQLVDLSVHPDYREHGIGSEIFDMRVSFCRKNKILYVGNTFDPSKPWLKNFYEKHGFKQINFAMWLEDSIELLKNRSEDEK